MICPHCGEDTEISDKYFRNLEAYNVESVLTISMPCCNKGARLRMNISFSLSKYTGDEREDLFGIIIEEA